MALQNELPYKIESNLTPWADVRFGMYNEKAVIFLVIPQAESHAL